MTMRPPENDTDGQPKERIPVMMANTPATRPRKGIVLAVPPVGGSGGSQRVTGSTQVTDDPSAGGAPWSRSLEIPRLLANTYYRYLLVHTLKGGSEMSNGFRPGEKAPRSGQYVIKGPPTPNPGQTFVLVDPTRNRAGRR